ncbi:MAG: 2-oxo acid dehydrogenase subunit E2 [Fimbriimonadales bacterium]|nr:2-oxo acid dehydrogenase subunit E2 [Fimbriimonadales bacterium]
MSSEAHPQVVPILLPQAGNTMEEGTILQWRVRPGDRVKVGQVLFELETDKATIEVEAEAEGRIARILVGEGQAAPVKSVVALLAEDDEAAERYLQSGSPAPVASAAEPSAPAGEPAAAPMGAVAAPQPGRRRASPAARAAAAALGVDLGALPQGSGPGGRILREDVERAAAARATPQAAPLPEGLPGEQPAPSPVAGERHPLSRMRKAIARNLAASKQQLPHWYLRTTIVADRLVEFHQSQKARFPCSLNDVVVLAVARAIQEMPAFRSRLEGDEVVTFDSVNIGIAVAVEEGLVVPVVRGADRLNLKGLAAESRRVVEAARQGRLEGVGEGVFTVSNLGMFGVEEFAAIINPPEVGILAVGSVHEDVVVQDGALRIGKRMTMTLSADHRLIDGVQGARFMARVRELLEDPSSWV